MKFLSIIYRDEICSLSLQKSVAATLWTIPEALSGFNVLFVLSLLVHFQPFLM